MTPEQWESLCDGCGRCCLIRLEDEEDGTVYTTGVTCRLLDRHACRCSDYPNRYARVDGCIKMTIDHARNAKWLPSTCGYVRVARGLDLEPWHPLVSGDPESVHAAGVSVRGKALCETEIAEEDLELMIIDEA